MDKNTAMVWIMFIMMGIPMIAVVLMVWAAKHTKGDDDEP